MQDEFRRLGPAGATPLAASGETSEAAAPIFPAPFRLGRRSDARAIAELIEIAGEGIPSFLWSLQAAPGQSPLEIGIARAARKDANFSYRNALLAESEGAVVGLLLAYRLDEPDAQEIAGQSPILPLLRPLVELERQAPGSFYINALAVRPGERDRGLGSRFLTLAAALAAAAGCTALSVVVFAQNAGAVRFYRRHGYELRDRRPLVPHPCYPYDGEAWLLIKALREPERPEAPAPSEAPSER